MSHCLQYWSQHSFRILYFFGTSADCCACIVNKEDLSDITAWGARWTEFSRSKDWKISSKQRLGLSLSKHQCACVHALAELQWLFVFEVCLQTAPQSLYSGHIHLDNSSFRELSLMMRKGRPKLQCALCVCMLARVQSQLNSSYCSWEVCLQTAPQSIAFLASFTWTAPPSLYSNW